MENTVNGVGFCDFCQKLKTNNKTFLIYRVGFKTNQGEFHIGILNICEELGDYLINRGCHLSSTQIMLLRPDIMLDFLKEKYNTNTETVKEYHLCEAEICSICFDEYVKKVPER